MAETQEAPNGANENKEISDNENEKISDMEKEKLGQLNLGLAGKPEGEQSHADDLAEAEAGQMTDLEKKKAAVAFKKRLADEQKAEPDKEKLPDTPDWAA